jgi:hypothetical protein
MHKLNINGDIVTDPSRILKEQAKFYDIHQQINSQTMFLINL